MAAGKMTATQATSHAALSEAATAGAIPWATLLQLLIQYGPQILAFIMSILPLLKKGVSLDVAIQWIHDAMDAVTNGKPLPPLPVP